MSWRECSSRTRARQTRTRIRSGGGGKGHIEERASRMIFLGNDLRTFRTSEPDWCAVPKSYRPGSLRAEGVVEAEQSVKSVRIREIRDEPLSLSSAYVPACHAPLPSRSAQTT